MTGLKKQLTLRDGIPLALGSIIGSGILFLPSLTYQVAESDVSLVWIFTTLLCLPLLVIFKHMLRTVPHESGLEGYVSLGLGEKIASSIPLLFLGTVGLGMPSAGLIAGQYLHDLTGHTDVIIPIAALAIVWLSIISNNFGIHASSRIQQIISLGLFAVGAGLFFLTFEEASQNYSTLTPGWNMPRTLLGVTIAFWAYAGFENLTFLAGEFKRPERDLFLSIVIALLLSGLLYIGLTLNYASLVPLESVKTTLGLTQLAARSTGKATMSGLISIFAVVAVQFNFNSWTWGVSRLIYSSAKKGLFPVYFSKLNKSQVPARALVFLGLIFSVNILIGFFFPNLFERVLVVVSTNFVFLYLLAVGSYIKLNKIPKWKLLGLSIFITLAFCISQSGWLLLYPLAIVSVAAVIAMKRQGVLK